MHAYSLPTLKNLKSQHNETKFYLMNHRQSHSLSYPHSHNLKHINESYKKRTCTNKQHTAQKANLQKEYLFKKRKHQNIQIKLYNGIKNQTQFASNKLSE